MSPRPFPSTTAYRTNLQIWDLQGGRCFYCDKQIRKRRFMPKEASRANGYTVDHFFPVCRGFGLSHGKVLACRACNAAKGKRMPTAAEEAKFITVFITAGAAL